MCFPALLLRFPEAYGWPLVATMCNKIDQQEGDSYAHEGVNSAEAKQCEQTNKKKLESHCYYGPIIEHERKRGTY